MFCYKCGANIPDDAQFCAECGTPSAAQLVQPQALVTKPRIKRSSSAGIGFFGLLMMLVIVGISSLLLSGMEDEELAQIFGSLADVSVANVAWSLLPLTILAVYAGMKYFSLNVRAVLTVGLLAMAVYLIAVSVVDIREYVEVIDDIYSDPDKEKFELLAFIPQYVAFALPSVMLMIYLGIKTIIGTNNAGTVNVALMSCFAFEVACVLRTLFSAWSLMCHYISYDIDADVMDYPFVYGVVKMVLVLLFFVALDMLVFKEVKAKNDAEESKE